MSFVRLSQEAAILGEGPCWHAEEQVLYWVDILGRRLHRHDPGESDTASWDLPEMAGTVAPRRSGGLILGLHNDVASFDPATGNLKSLVTVDPNPKTRLNDGKCDPRGRFWVGSMDLEEKEAIGGLYCMDASGRIEQWADGIGVSNGMTWSPDERRMYYIDSPTRRVDVFDMDPESGRIGNRRPLVEFSEDEGFPDGMTSDAEGNLWIAHWGGARLTKRHPQTGECLATLNTKAFQTSACCFGGSELRDLYVTTARVDLSPEQQAEYTDSGHLLHYPVDQTGSPTYAFAG